MTKLNNDTHNTVAVAETILGRPLATHLEILFECMELAEKEIASAKQRSPEHAERLHTAFLALQPSTPLLHRCPERLFRAHCRELLERVTKSHDLRPATTAEVVAVLSAMSLEHPLDRPATVLYWEGFTALFPEEATRVRAEIGPVAADSRDRECARELEAKLRKKLAVPSRTLTAADQPSRAA